MLHVDNKVGSIKVGKDADLVIWSDNPLSIYARAEKTIVDGTVYFDREKDAAMRIQNKNEKARLIQKLTIAKRTSTPGAAGFGGGRGARPRFELINSCEDHEHHNHGLLGVDADEMENNNSLEIKN
jgi:hypothetical protein